ncbi:uncharacterized protein ACNLHF_021117 [Anomaloglossus baeobatrachus]
MTHVWCECSGIKQFGGKVLTNYQLVTGKTVENCPKITLLSTLPHSIAYLRFCLAAARSIIPRYWKSSTITPISEWYSEMLKQRSSEFTEAKPQLNPAATSFYPGTSHPFTPDSPYAPGASRVVVATSGEKSDMSEFARFMVSRELINTSLTKFDDRAESYRAWKATFKAAIANLNLTAEQELDLMIKWLGPGSTNRIKSLRTVYVGQAEAGLAAAWQRLERTFGSAEAIEKALFKRLQDIPKINLKEVHKLQDLSDLLMELELAKRDPRLSGLCYLDTAHGVNPIVVKLPYSLQEKWATSVSRYKRVFAFGKCCGTSQWIMADLLCVIIIEKFTATNTLLHYSFDDLKHSYTECFILLMYIKYLIDLLPM